MRSLVTAPLYNVIKYTPPMSCIPQAVGETDRNPGRGVFCCTPCQGHVLVFSYGFYLILTAILVAMMSEVYNKIHHTPEKIISGIAATIE